MRYLMTGIFFFHPIYIHSQALLDREISIAVRSMPLDEVLNKLQQEYAIFFSYGFDNATSKTPISVSAEAISIYDLLWELARQADLEFIMVGSTIVFRRVSGSTTRCSIQNTVGKQRELECTHSNEDMFLQRKISVPLQRLNDWKYIHVPIVISPVTRQYALVEVIPRFKVMFQVDLNRFQSGNSGSNSNQRLSILRAQDCVGVNGSYQVSSGTLLELSYARSFNISIANLWRASRAAMHDEISVACLSTGVGASKTLIGLSVNLSCIALQSKIPVTINPSFRYVYVPFVLANLDAKIYSIALSLLVDHRIGSSGSIFCKGRFSVHETGGATEHKPTSARPILVDIGFRYTLFSVDK